MDVEYHQDAERELENLRIEHPTEAFAMQNAIEKLEVLGDQLLFPHSSNVKGADRLRELRPRRGRSPWRAFYRRIGATMVIGSIGPDAKDDKRGFDRAVVAAVARLGAVEEAWRERP